VSAWQKEPWQAHDSWWAVEEWLELLALSSEPEELLGILSNLPKNFIGPRRLERVLNGLKNSPAPGADEVLLQLAELVPGLDHNPAWLEAALAQSSEAMLEACVAILWDPSRAAKVDLHHPAGKAFVAKLACMFSTDATARAGLLAKLGTTLAAPVQRLLARVVLEMADDDDLLLAYMSILSNDQQPPHYLYELIKHRVTDSVPLDAAGSTYEIVPSSAAALRRRLFEMVLYDRQRDRMARGLLVWIDDHRDRYGRPDDEPRHPWLASDAPWPIVEQPQDLMPS